MSQGQKPGGTLGIRARHEVLKVLEVRPSGVLLLQNQAMERIEKHMEHCVPCMLPNILGDTYAGLLRPPEDHPCQICKDDRQWDLMLLCDNCDAGYHTYCLDPPLDSVPDGHWICPQCASLGVTHDVLQRKLARYRKAEVSRPALELPSRSRIAKAQRYIDEWHGHGIIQNSTLKRGRIVFQGILEPKWFRIHWGDGTSSEHTPHILRHLSYCDEEELPEGVPGIPAPILLLVATAANTGSAVPPETPDQFSSRVRELLPGESLGRDAAVRMSKAAAALRLRGSDQPQVTPAECSALGGVLDLSPIRQFVVVASTADDCFLRHCQRERDAAVLINEPGRLVRDDPNRPSWPGKGAHFALDPTSPAFAQYFLPGNGVDMFYVNLDPVLFPVILPPLLEASKKLIAVRVPYSWDPYTEGHLGWWLQALIQEQRVLWVDPLCADGFPTTHRWLLVFGDADEKSACTDCRLAADMVQVTCQHRP